MRVSAAIKSATSLDIELVGRVFLPAPSAPGSALQHADARDPWCSGTGPREVGT